MSGIYIPGVELPPIDEYLHLRIDGNGYVSMQISENQYICDLYDTDKKAVELPPHGRCIDADAFLARNAYFADREFVNPKFDDTLKDLIDRADTIIPAEEE